MVTKTPKKVVVNVAMTEHVYDKLNDLRGGVSIRDYIAELVAEHLKKQKKIPPEVVDMAEVS
jgi:predicted CopG family antitoxin